jgi:hypothetical protein
VGIPLLPESAFDDPTRADWELYRSEVTNWISQGYEGHWVLICVGRVVGIWETELEAELVRRERFTHDNVLLKQIREWEPLLRTGWRMAGLVNHSC